MTDNHLNRRSDDERLKLILDAVQKNKLEYDRVARENIANKAETMELYADHKKYCDDNFKIINDELTPLKKAYGIISTPAHYVGWSAIAVLLGAFGLIGEKLATWFFKHFSN